MTGHGRWPRLCVVGIGGHARTKLIPAIRANGQVLAGLVSRQPADALPDAPVFDRVEDALAALPADTAFLLASPPAAHAAQAQAVLAAGRDLLVEKPAFVTTAEARAAVARAGPTVVLAEAFMQRHTGLYRRLLDWWAMRRADVAAIDATFVVPSLPPATFRAGGGMAASPLYDIGCYVVALLGDLGLDHGALKIVDVTAQGTPNERVTLAGVADGVAVTATIGVAPDYANRVVLQLKDGSSTSLYPFFYGRAGDRRIETAGEVETLAEGDAFRTMLARPRAEWLADQPERLARLVVATATLERLGAQRAAFRA